MENMDSLPESSDSTLLNSVDAKGVDYSTAMSLLTEEDPNEEKVNATVEEAKKLVIYDENGRVNGSEWSKAIQIIHKHISWGSQEGLKAWNLAFDKILSPEGQVIETHTYRDGGSKKWILNNGTTVYLYNGFDRTRIGHVTVTYPDKSEETFDKEGNRVTK